MERAKRVIRLFMKNRLAAASLVVFIIVLLFCILGPLFTPYDYSTIDVKNCWQSPSLQHPMGTDGIGRDTMTRLMYGGRTTFSITFTAVLISLLGILPGVAAGFWGGRVDNIISRINDALGAIPTFLMVIFAENMMGWGGGNYRYAMGVALIPPIVRIARSATMEVVGKEYVEAARALGVGSTGIILTHIMRNILSPIIVHVSSSLADTLVMCTLMGYLGIGVNPPEPEWGNIVHGGYAVILSKPIQMIIPSSLIVICVLSLNLIGNGLRDGLETGKERS